MSIKAQYLESLYDDLDNFRHLKELRSKDTTFTAVVRGWPKYRVHVKSEYPFAFSSSARITANTYPVDSPELYAPCYTHAGEAAGIYREEDWYANCIESLLRDIACMAATEELPKAQPALGVYSQEVSGLMPRGYEIKVVRQGRLKDRFYIGPIEGVKDPRELRRFTESASRERTLELLDEFTKPFRRLY